MAHPRVIAWQETWMANKDSHTTGLRYSAEGHDEIDCDEMDCEEAIERSRSLWDLSQCAEALLS